MSGFIRPLAVYTLGRTVFEVWPDSCRTILPDGASVAAAPQDTDAYRATAQRLGYGADTLRMSIEHDLLHIFLCDILGLNESPTLRRVANKTEENTISFLEEDMVIAVTRFCNQCGINIADLISKRK